MPSYGVQLLQRVPQALWQLVLHCAFLALATAAFSVLAPVLVFARCCARCARAMFVTRPRLNRSAWKRSVAVVIGADTRSGALLTSYFATCGASQVIAAGQNGNRLHDACDRHRVAKIVRTLGVPRADSKKITDLLSDAPENPAVVAFAVPREAGREDAERVLAERVEYAALVGAQIGPLLQRVAHARRSEVPLAPRFVVVSDGEDFDAAADAMAAALREATVRAAAADGSPRPLVEVLRVADCTAVAAVPETPTAGADSPQASPTRGGGAEQRDPASDSAVAEALGDAVCDARDSGHGLTVRASRSPYTRVVDALCLREWAHTALPAAFGVRAGALSLL